LDASLAPAILIRRHVFRPVQHWEFVIDTPLYFGVAFAFEEGQSAVGRAHLANIVGRERPHTARPRNSEAVYSFPPLCHAWSANPPSHAAAIALAGMYRLKSARLWIASAVSPPAVASARYAAGLRLSRMACRTARP